MVNEESIMISLNKYALLFLEEGFWYWEYYEQGDPCVWENWGMEFRKWLYVPLNLGHNFYM